MDASVPSAQTLLDWGVVATEVSGALLDQQTFVPIEAGNTLRELMVRVFAAGATRSFILYHGGIYYTAALTLQAGEHREQALLYFRRFTKALFFLEELIANSEGDVLLIAAMGSPLCLLSGRLHKKKVLARNRNSHAHRAFPGIPAHYFLSDFFLTNVFRKYLSNLCFNAIIQMIPAIIFRSFLPEVCSGVTFLKDLASDFQSLRETARPCFGVTFSTLFRTYL